MANNNRVNGVRFDNLHSYNDFGMWLALRPDYGKPAPKTNTVDVPGMDGVLDMTEANSGEVKYSNRTLTFTFAKKIDLKDQEDFKTQVRAALHGKYIKQIIPDETPDWYYSGRAEVTFAKLSSWKLRCVITVDAAPYAMKVDETIVDFDPAVEAETLQIVVPGVDVVQVGYNSDLRFGTKTFPDGLNKPLNSFDQLYITWPSDGQLSGGPSKEIYIYDADGNEYHTTFVTHGTLLAIPVTNITSAGVNLDKVYRVLVSFLRGCKIYWEEAAKKYTLSNSRKSVVPLVELDADEEIVASINGENKVIYPGIAVYEDIVLPEGDSEVYLPLVSFRSLKMTYREGRL